MTFRYFYIFYIFRLWLLYIVFYICIYILLIYSRAILSFAWLTGDAMRPVVLSYTVHTDSFTAHNNDNNNNNYNNFIGHCSVFCGLKCQ